MFTESVEIVGGVHVYLPERLLKTLSHKYNPVKITLVTNEILFENNLRRINPNLRQFSIIPRKLPLTPELFYFLGLWKGDGISGHHVGIVNRDIGLLKATKLALIHIFLQRDADTYIQIYAARGVPTETVVNFRKNLEELGKVKEKVERAYGEKGLAARLFVNNTPLRRYILEPLTSTRFLNEIFDCLPNLFFPYFAGLFDAEGWIDFKRELIKVGWKDRPQSDLIYRYLLKLDFDVIRELRRDGIVNLISKDLEKFYIHVLPFVNHEEKINDFLMLRRGEFKLTKWHLGAVECLKKCSDTAAGISKQLGCSKERCQTILRQLWKMNMVQRKRKEVERKNPSSILKPFEYSLLSKAKSTREKQVDKSG